MKLDAVNNLLAYHMTESLLSLRKVVMLMFVDLEKGNLLYKINIVVSSLILKMRSEEIFLSKCRCFSMDYGLL